MDLTVNKPIKFNVVPDPNSIFTCTFKLKGTTEKIKVNIGLYIYHRTVPSLTDTLSIVESVYTDISDKIYTVNLAVPNFDPQKRADSYLTISLHPPLSFNIKIGIEDINFGKPNIPNIQKPNIKIINNIVNTNKKLNIVREDLIKEDGYRTINFCPYVVQNSGYGMLADNIYISLLKISSQYKYKIIDGRKYVKTSLPCSNISLILCVPLGFFKTNARINIGYTMFEATKIPRIWPVHCNKMDMLFVPCQSNVDIFRNCGVKVPINVIPIGINTDIYNPNITNKNFPFNNIHVIGAYKFLVINDGQKRKNNEMIISAFEQEFKKEIDQKRVYLVIKTKMPRNYQGKNIYVVGKYLVDNELRLLINSCDCMISASSGEAGDIPILSGMAMEKPVIASSELVHPEYIEHEKTGFLIKTTKLVPAYRDVSYACLSFYEYLDKDTMWSLPDFDDLKKNMRYVYENRDITKEIGINARKYMLENRTTDIAVKKMIDVFDKII